MKKILFIISLIITSLVFADGNNNKSITDSGTKKSKTIEITGLVYDGITNECLAGVKIEIDNETIYTDFDGKFTTIIYPGEHKIKSSYISYKDATDTINFQYDKDLIISILPQK